MSFARFSVGRPVFMCMLAAMIIILGGISLVRLPVDLMPDITYPTISVSVQYENAAPQEMEELVARPLEEALSSVPGVEEVTTSSLEGSTRARVQMAWGTDLDAAANDIRDRLDRILPRLPDDAERPILRKFDVAAFPILILGAGSSLDPIEMQDVLERQVKYRIERVPGVAAVDIMGGVDREIHVQLNPEKIKALGIAMNTILDRVRTGNTTAPAGVVESAHYDVTIRTQGEYANLDEIRNTVVAARDGAYIRVRDIATVEDTWRRLTRRVRVDGQPGVRLSVNKQSGANTAEVADAVKKEIVAINRDLPQVHISTIIDTSTYIKRSITNVASTAWQGGLLAILVLLFFLRNVRSTAVVATAIPLSIVATFGLVYFSGFTLNIMTLGGLALGIGMLLDNAIVVLENIRRLEEEGRDPIRSSIDGAEEVTAAIVSSTLTTLAVFLPMVFVRGMTGVMFKQLAIVVSFSLACSLIVAMTLVPMLAARVPVPRTENGMRHRGLRRLGDGIGRFLKAMEEAYRVLLRWALTHRKSVVLAAALLLAAAFALKPFIGVELMPATDEGEVRVDIEMEPGSRLDIVDAVVLRCEEIVRREVPESVGMVASSGGGNMGPSSGSGNMGQIRVALKPRAERTRSSEDVANALRPLFKPIPGAVIRTRAGQGLFILRVGAGGGDRLEVEIRGHDLEIADRLAAQVRASLHDIPGITDVRLSRESGAPEERVVVNRTKAADLGLTVTDIAQVLETALGGSIASYYRVAGKEYPIRVQLEGAERMRLSEVLGITLQSRDGQGILLRNVIDTVPGKGPVLIDRKDQERIVTASANFTGRDMGSVLKDAQTRIKTIAMPQGFELVFAGDYEEQQKSFKELFVSIILAIILVYMVMACQYESLRDPLVVMFSVPLAAVGVLLMLFLTRTTFNIQSYIGCIMLGGIVVNNAILLVDHTNLLIERDRMPLMAAIEEAGRRRLRPILMTTLTTVLGLLPLAIGLGEGGEAQAPLARAVIGGLSSSTLITLLVVPVIYSIFHRGKYAD